MALDTSDVAEALRQLADRLQGFDLSGLGASLDPALPGRAMSKRDAMVALAKTLSHATFEALPDPLVADLRKSLGRLYQSTPTHAPIRANEGDAYVAHLNDCLKNMAPLLALSLPGMVEAGTVLSEIKGIKDEAAGELSAVKGHTKRAENLLASTEEQVRHYIEDHALKGQADFFEVQASAHSRQAMRWLWTTIGISLLAVAVIGAVFWQQLFGHILHLGEAPPLVWSEAVARVALVSFVSSIVVWTGRNYRAHRHNEVVNRHRQNSVRTLHVLANQAAETDGAREAMLIEATRAVFGAQPSGYGQIESAPGMPALLEVFRSAPGGK